MITDLIGLEKFSSQLTTITSNFDNLCNFEPTIVTFLKYLRSYKPTKFEIEKNNSKMNKKNREFRRRDFEKKMFSRYKKQSKV